MTIIVTNLEIPEEAMKTAAISKLKAKLSEHIAWVKRGEEVLITERGKPVARIVPVAPGALEDDRLRELIARGIVRPGRGQVRRVLSRLPVRRLPKGTAARLIDEERRERD